jgi:hypothetical protein
MSRHSPPAPQIRALPPLRALVLAVKARLNQAGLNQVFTGGLASWCIFLMVVAHLQAEGLPADPDPALSCEAAFVGKAEQVAFLESLEAQVRGCAGGSERGSLARAF